MKFPPPSKNQLTGTRAVRLLQVMLILVLFSLLILTRRDLGIAQATLEKQQREKITAVVDVRSNNPVHALSKTERPKDSKSLLARLKKKPASPSDVFGNDAYIKARIIFLQMSPEELTAFLLEIQRLNLPAETTVMLNSLAGEILATYSKETMVRNLWGKGIDFGLKVDLVGAFKDWLWSDIEAATAWYDEYGKASPLSSGEMQEAERAIIHSLLGSNHDSIRLRLASLPLEERCLIYDDVVRIDYQPHQLEDYPSVAMDLLKIATDLGLPPKQINRAKDSIASHMYGEPLEDYKKMLDDLQMDPERFRDNVESYVFGHAHDFLRETYDEERENELLQATARNYEWAESAAPGSGISALQSAASDFFSHVEPSEDIINRAVKLQSLIRNVDIINPLVDSLNAESQHEMAKALKARMSQLK